MVSTLGFGYRGHHLVCPQGKILRRGSFHNRGGAYQYVACRKDCQACPAKTDSLPRGQKRRYIGLIMYCSLHLRARKRNRTAAYHREQINRRIATEGTFASLDRLGGARSRLRGLRKVDCEGYMTALGSQPAEDGAQAEPWCRPSGPSVASCPCECGIREPSG